MDKQDEPIMKDLVSKIIESEKKDGIKKFNNSDFEQKLYNRIRGRRRGMRVSLKWILVPASLALLVISALFLFRGDGRIPPTPNNFQLALESVVKENAGLREIPEEWIEKNKKVENLQKQILRSIKGSEIGVKDLTGHIVSSMISVTGKNGLELKISGDIPGNNFMLIKKDISNMNKKDDYSELFSRIIINLTEG